MKNILKEANEVLSDKTKLQKIVEAACLVYNIDISSFYSKVRYRHFVDCRRMVYVICREDLEMSWIEIANSFKINHATAIHHLKIHKQLMNYDSIYRDRFNNFRELAKAGIGYVDIKRIINEVAKKTNEENSCKKE